MLHETAGHLLRPHVLSCPYKSQSIDIFGEVARPLSVDEALDYYELPSLSLSQMILIFDFEINF